MRPHSTAAPRGLLREPGPRFFAIQLGIPSLRAELGSMRVAVCPSSAAALPPLIAASAAHGPPLGSEVFREEIRVVSDQGAELGLPRLPDEWPR